MTLITDFVQHKVYKTEAEAIAAAAILQSGDEDGWTYTVSVDPKGTGKAIVQAFDETGAFVCNMIG